MNNKTSILNPIIYSDFPDPCVIDVDEIFYMTTTSMYFMPGIPVMRSYDLANWEIISYVYPTFSNEPAHNMEEDKNIYSKGSWATSLRFHKGYFYVCFNSNDTQNTYIYRTLDIEKGIWEQSILNGFHHDPSLLFDDDARTYLVYGNGTIYILELSEDAMSIKLGGVDQVLVETPKVTGLNCEGCHFHKVNGQYYLMMIQWANPNVERRIQWCYRSTSLLGAYEGKIVLNDDMGYQNKGVAQGGLFQAGNQWYAMLFQDRGALGRCPILLPVEWVEGWPILGVNHKVPKQFSVDLVTHISQPTSASDEFESNTNILSPIWQWNHNPDNDSWSCAERVGYLRLYNTQITNGLLKARNTLAQRTMGPTCSFWTKLDTKGMKKGDCAGIAALQLCFGYIGISVEDSGNNIVMCIADGNHVINTVKIPFALQTILLKIDFDFTDGIDIATFSYAEDRNECGINWKIIDQPLHMLYGLEHFTGYHAALFSYATNQTGGYADFDYMHFSNNIS